jgi:hypothetical protein
LNNLKPMSSLNREGGGVRIQGFNYAGTVRMDAKNLACVKCCYNNMLANEAVEIVGKLRRIIS